MYKHDDFFNAIMSIKQQYIKSAVDEVHYLSYTINETPEVYKGNIDIKIEQTYDALKSEDVKR